MCQHCSLTGEHDRLVRLAKTSPETDRVIEQMIADFAAILQNWHDSILDALGEIGVDLAQEGAVRVVLERRLDPYRESWDIVFENVWKDSAEAGRSTAIRRHNLDISFDIVDPETTAALEDHGRKAAEQTQHRMTGDMASAISDAYQAGYGIDEIAQLLRDDVFEDMKTWEARRCARTEGMAGANKGRLISYKDAGAAGKRWMARDDDDTRDSHENADNQTVPITEPFTIGKGYSAQYPGDPNLPVGERANCRCLVQPEWDVDELAIEVSNHVTTANRASTAI